MSCFFKADTKARHVTILCLGHIDSGKVSLTLLLRIDPGL